MAVDPLCETCGYTFLEPPADEGGLCRAFDLADLAGIGEFFDRFGFVVVDLLGRSNGGNQGDAAATGAVDEGVLDGLELELMQVAGLDRGTLGEEGYDDKLAVENLDRVNWSRTYGSRYNEGKGFVGYMPAVGPDATRLRQNERVLAVYASLLKRRDLLAKLDRFGLMRPTRGRPEYRTEKGFVHWDQNPTFEPRFARVQGIVTLSDHTATSGGFHCVPGFVKHFRSHGEKMNLSSGSSDLVALDDECLRTKHLARILAKRGSLILWDSRTPHGNWPQQESDEWRKVLYMTFFPTPDDAYLVARRKIQIKGTTDLKPMVAELNAVGRRLFALDPYPEEFKPTAEEMENGPDLDSCFSRRQNGLG
mmetsp:Transcript_23782/g.66649  ORF Transcript_23782/g.66649 Transcript_23782/m.66649 type:complete len:364 (-) Transcript_23782:181-1272(-)|eukprot:CAMPEP_0119128466 /NCGR_PEP_ID=MMETSP1310-20130426/6609_1 /TAXON_ID=464262 /ORGANISM="Genus nov. species nov., Strain RCC2339" /LENGTH=363 /DNA_ID=CAMNT_0007118807 /DNA_START=178 /DNA_END=1269 /DNA_ORIENTATION=+